MGDWIGRIRLLLLRIMISLEWQLFINEFWVQARASFDISILTSAPNQLNLDCYSDYYAYGQSEDENFSRNYFA